MALTVSEELFEQYLASQGITNFEYEKKHEGKRKRPDYTVDVDSQTYIFDVKEFGYPPDASSFSGFYSPLPAVREKINQAAKQFKEFKDLPCCLVLYNKGDPFVHLQDEHEMLGAMYGNFGIALDFDIEAGRSVPGTERPIFGEKGKMIQPHWSRPQNTTISALITLRQVPIGQMRYGKFIRDLREQSLLDDSILFEFDINEEQLSIIVWENIFARISFPRNLFCGPYDERYGADGEYIRRVFAGNGVLEYEELHK